MSASSENNVQIASAADATALGRCIGESFATDPVSRWTFGGPAAIVAAYTLLAERLYVPSGHATMVAECGGALWLAPNQSKSLSFTNTFVMATLLAQAGELRNVPRSALVDRAMRARRPKTPHHYLFAIGVLPEARGRGIASTLIRHTLAIADRDGVPAYLENTNPRNTPLYERFGFRAGEAFSPAPGCPPLVPMWREPAR